ncbi:hypothetical protein FDECE_15740 [Fusarium decemcellulare]|nr:hypothetical protein FDECE_15740 [Fusarium decemcellulare]
MPSDSSQALVPRGLFAGLWQKQLKKSSSKASDSKESNPNTLSIPDDDVFHKENKSIWKEVKATDGNPGSLIFAVVASDQKKPMKKLLEEKKRRGKIQSTVVVTTQKHLQDLVDTTVNAQYKTLHLFVSPAVNQMTYNVEGAVTRVFITPCGANGRPDALRIGSSSTYCGVKSYPWDQRTDPKQLKKQLVHNPGCVFDLSDDLDEAKRLLGNPVMSLDLSEEEKDDIRRQFDGFHNDLIRGPPEPKVGKHRRVSSDSEGPPAPSADGTGTWFQRWKGLLATIVAAGAGVAGMAGAFWISAGGIIVKGPLGFCMAAGYFNAAGIGTAFAAGGTAGIVAYGAIYFIPWDRLWNLLKQKLWSVWEYIRDTICWIWSKLKQLAGTVLSKVSLASDDMPKAARFSA